MGNSTADFFTGGASRRKRERAQTDAENFAIAEQARLESEDIANEERKRIEAIEAGQKKASVASKRGRKSTMLTRRGGLGSARSGNTLLGRS